jgi:probable phosphoglycerate mutase
MARVLLLRHGETDWNCDRLVQGWAPVALNERGREQARAAGTHLASAYDVDSVVASDLRRTRETAALAGESGLPDPVFERDWRERGFGVLQGLGYEAVFGEYPEYDNTSENADTLEARPENGESLLDVRERVLRGWASVLEGVGATSTDDGTDSGEPSPVAANDGDEGNEGTVLVVTHGGPIYVLLAHLEGISLPTMFDREHQANCAINEISVDSAVAGIDTDEGDRGIEIVRYNDTSYRES